MNYSSCSHVFINSSDTCQKQISIDTYNFHATLVVSFKDPAKFELINKYLCISEAIIEAAFSTLFLKLHI